MLACHLYVETDLFAGPTGNDTCPDDSIFKFPREKASHFVTSLSCLKIVLEGNYINLLMMNPLDFSKDLMDT